MLLALMVDFVLEEIACGHFLDFMPLEIYHQCLDAIPLKHVWVVEGHHVLSHMKALDVVLAILVSIEITRCSATSVVHRLR